MLLHIIIFKLYPYSKRFSSRYTLIKSEFILCNFGMIFFFAVKTPVKSSISKFIYKKVKKNFATSLEVYNIAS